MKEVLIDKYHHGDLRESLICNGLKLLNEKGLDGFSLRKVASLCNVSHSAPYKHFKNKEELINCILETVTSKFYNSLNSVLKDFNGNSKELMITLGKEYVKFMVENPDYLKFLFFNENTHPISLNYEIFNSSNNDFNNSSKKNAFILFKNASLKYLKDINIDPKDYITIILSMWSIAHGYAVLITTKSIFIETDYLLEFEKMACRIL